MPIIKINVMGSLLDVHASDADAAKIIRGQEQWEHKKKRAEKTAHVAMQRYIRSPNPQRRPPSHQNMLWPSEF
jgi:hypothetical protein